MPSILGANTLSSGFDVANSARFNDGDSAYMNLTSVNTVTNRLKFTISLWVKRSTLGAKSMIGTVGGDNSNFGAIWFDSNDKLNCTEGSGGGELNFITNRVFRDVSAWYHIVLAIDTTQGTESNRVKIYVNGVQETSFGTSTYPSQNSNMHLNRGGKAQYLGRHTDSSNDYYFDGYMAEVVWIDGSQEAVTSFGEFDEDSGIWKPIDVSGLTFGNNGFYLDFEDSANLGNDVNGGTDWTETNFAATDQSTDTCTNNFCTVNALDSISTGGTFSEGNTTVQSTTSNRGIFTGTFGLSSGKWYWEIKTSASAGTHASDEWNFIGVSNLPASNTDNILASSGTNSNKLYEYAIHGYDGDFYNNASDETYGASFTTGDIIGVFLDLDNNRIYWSKNGLWADGSGNSDEADPNGFKSVTDPASTIGGFYFPACGDGGTNVNKTWQWNFGGTPGFAISSGNNDPNGYGNFEYPTEGAYAICSKNLAEYG